jgi:NAD(P)-dependent dehydrogenase (short-subunit alcohol dehydrogenase family)
MGRLQGKVAIVTGAASGIGEETARVLAREGARVVLTDLREDLGYRITESIVGDGGNATFVRHDVASEASWQAVMSQVQEVYRGLHIVVNNAGIGFPAGDVEQQSLEDWRHVLAVNMDSVFLGTKYGIKGIRSTGATGSIINISSILGIVGSGTTAAYTASKGGVRLFTKSAALHCAKAGYQIRVNSVHPGFISTPMLEESLHRRGQFESNRKKLEELTPLGHTGSPADIAYGVLYLASDESAFVTGSELIIDGGFLAQ